MFLRLACAVICSACSGVILVLWLRSTSNRCGGVGGGGVGYGQELASGCTGIDCIVRETKSSSMLFDAVSSDSVKGGGFGFGVGVGGLEVSPAVLEALVSVGTAVRPGVPWVVSAVVVARGLPAFAAAMSEGDMRPRLSGSLDCGGWVSVDPGCGGISMRSISMDAGFWKIGDC